MDLQNENLDTSTTRIPVNADTDVDTSVDRGDDVSYERGHDRERGKRKERPSIRDTIRQSFDDVRQNDDRSTRDVGDQDREPEEVEASQEQEPEVAPDKTKKAEVAAPTSWTKEAKASWNELPDRIKQEVVKRETDIQKGVDSLKKQYVDIDDAIAPYAQVIKQFQKTPAQAVSQLFSWFDALAKDPDRAFPALLQSYRYEPARLLASYGIDPNELAQFIQWKQSYTSQQQHQQSNGQFQQGQQPIPGQQPQQPEEINPAVRQYIDGLHRELSDLKYQVGSHFDGLAQTFAAQNQAKTQEMLGRWASDKPYFEQVRVMMGHLLTPDQQTGQAAIPLREDGTVDLDSAYDRACWMIPEIRQYILDEQQNQMAATQKAKQEAALKAQQDKANQARRAAPSVRTSAPGTQVGRQQTPQRGLSVRDSLKQAIQELGNT